MFSVDKTQAISTRVGEWIVDRRLLLLIVSALVTVLTFARSVQLDIDPGFAKSIPFGNSYMKVYDRYDDEFGSANTILISLTPAEGDIFSPEFLRHLQDATREVILLPGVNRGVVTSLFTPNVFFTAVDEYGFVGGRIVPALFNRTAEEIQQVRDNLLKSSEVGRLVSPDFRSALIRAEIVETDPSTGVKLDYLNVARRLSELERKYEALGVEVRVVGFTRFVAEIVASFRIIFLFFALALLVTYFALRFYLGSWYLSFLALSAALIAVIWQLGIVEWLGYGIDPLSILVPFLILSIGVSHAVQMINAWRLGVLGGRDSGAAAVEAFGYLFIPGTTALVANAVGFAVIMLIDIGIIHELGIMASIGVAVMIITNKFLLPALLSYVAVERATGNTRVIDWMSRFWHPFGYIVVGWPRYLIIAAGLALLLVGFVYRDQVVLGDVSEGVPELAADAEYNRDLVFIKNHFSLGIDNLMVFVESERDGCVNYKVVSAMDRVQRRLEEHPRVLSTYSVAREIKDRNVGNMEGHPKFRIIPMSEGMLAADLRGIELNQKLFNHDCSVMPINVFLADHRADTLHSVTQLVENFQVQGVRFSLAGGNAGVMEATNLEVKRAEMRMNMALFVGVSLLCFLTFLSLSATLSVVLPLVLAAYLVNWTMVVLNIGLKVSTLPVVALGIGVGVDYGIYLFSRILGQIRAGASFADAYVYGLRSTGTAVVFTAITMIFGVGTWLWSPLRFQADMGMLLVYMFFINMLGAILLAPALGSVLLKIAKRGK